MAYWLYKLELKTSESRALKCHTLLTVIMTTRCISCLDPGTQFVNLFARFSSMCMLLAAFLNRIQKKHVTSCPCKRPCKCPGELGANMYNLPALPGTPTAYWHFHWRKGCRICVRQSDSNGVNIYIYIHIYIHTYTLYTLKQDLCLAMSCDREWDQKTSSALQPVCTRYPLQVEEWEEWEGMRKACVGRKLLESLGVGCVLGCLAAQYEKSQMQPPVCSFRTSHGLVVSAMSSMSEFHWNFLKMPTPFRLKV